MNIKHLPPPVSRKQVNRAGEILKQGRTRTDEYSTALEVAKQWRLAHLYPLNTFQSRLRKIVNLLPGTLVAQRLKRMPTIIDKLHRHKYMKLSTMQDIGGVRAVLRDTETVYRVVRKFETSKRFTHILKDKKDYIATPKSDGYRGFHLIYRYNNTLARNSDAALYEGFLVEVQLRSKEQHAWATAVETMSTILDQPFKTRGGEKDWNKFFALMSSAVAIVENTNVLEEHTQLSPLELYTQIANTAKKIHALDAMQGYGLAANIIDKGSGDYYNLIVLDTTNKEVLIKGYSKNNYLKATSDYALEEQKAGSRYDVVLVSVGKLRSLKKAYPNYFLDLGDFIERVKVILNEVEHTSK